MTVTTTTAAATTVVTAAAEVAVTVSGEQKGVKKERHILCVLYRWKANSVVYPLTASAHSYDFSLFIDFSSKIHFYRAHFAFSSLFLLRMPSSVIYHIAFRYTYNPSRFFSNMVL